MYKTRSERRVFKRSAGNRQVEQTSWRHEDNRNRVVSTFLHKKWNNADHPRDDPGFSFLEDWGATGRWAPDNADEWETFQKTNYLSTEQYAKRSHRRFILALRNEYPEKYDHDLCPPRDGPDIRDAEAVAAFLATPFTARLPKDSQDGFQHQGRYEDCDTCNGKGRVVVPEEELDTCDADHHGDHDACSCDVNPDMLETRPCDDCNGDGENYSPYFTRSFAPILQPAQHRIDALVEADTDQQLLNAGIDLADLNVALDDAFDPVTVTDGDIRGLDAAISNITSPRDIPDEIEQALAIPDTNILQLIQVGIDMSVKRGDTEQPDHQFVREMFDLANHTEHDDLIDRIVEHMEPLLPDADHLAVTPDGEAFHPTDSDAIEQSRQELTATL
ncbi:hypothetical protein [Salinibaculum rarum]|uniref:hypothetical protein n=1 Tax=Salinibaculum rarum TaxID=3058903 RepID=UPI00265E156E|nr:hypothetical protein [Salinibaculum sp. KK48]